MTYTSRTTLLETSSKKQLAQTYMCTVCLFVWSQGRTYGKIPHHSCHSSPPGLISLHVPCPPPPPPPILMSCILHQIRTLPCLPVLYIYPYQVSGQSLPCLPVVHCVSNLLLHNFTNSISLEPSPLMFPPCLTVPASLTYQSGSLPLHRLV